MGITLGAISNIDRLNDNYFLVTNPWGSWTAVEKDELSKIIKKEISSDFLKKLLYGCCKFYENLVNPPSLIIIAITRECNLACKYCHADSGSGKERLEEKDIPKIIKLLLQLPQNSKIIEIQGGEPLINFRFLKQLVQSIWKVRHAINLSGIRVVSNLTLLEMRHIRFFQKYGIMVSTSLDGPDYIHNSQRPFLNGKESFEILKRKIKLAQGYGVFAGTIATLTKDTIKAGPIPLIETAISLNLKNIFYRPLRLTGRARKKDLSGLNGREIFNFVKNSVEFIKENNLDIRDNYFLHHLSNVWNVKRNYMCNSATCGAGINQIAISYDDTIIPCDAMRSLSSVPRLELDEIDYPSWVLSFSFFRQYPREIHPLCDMCPYSGFCNLCMTSNFSEFGSFFQYTPFSELCKFKKSLFRMIFEYLLEEEWRETFIKWMGGKPWNPYFLIKPPF